MSKQLAKMLMAGANTDTLADKTSKVGIDSAFKLQKTTIRLFKSDLQYLKESYPDNYNAQIRRIINQWVKQRLEIREQIRSNLEIEGD